jgi:hypothetical protein
MKHLAPWLTVLLAGCFPLTAAAFDYGPNHPLLAAENGAPQLPALQSHQTSADSAKPGVTATSAVERPDPMAPRMTPSASSPPPDTARSRGPTASAKPLSATSTPPATAPGPATWQSLLPGSIQ